MALISIRDLKLAFGGPLLFDGVNLQVEGGERICLVGRNGAGKTSLLRILHGDLVPDSGEVYRQRGLKTALLPQEVPQDLHGAIFDIVAGGLDSTNADLQRAWADSEGWRNHQRVERALSQLNLDPAADFASLSAGLKRRVLLARGLVCEPDLLLLDEPTNHLDIDAIAWLEDFLLRFAGTLVFVTHDRMFLRKIATRIVEFDRGSLVSWACAYDTYRERREAALEVEASHWQKFDKKLAEEETWIRQGVKARRTRNEGRVRALQVLREARRRRREHTGSAKLRAQEAQRSGKLVIEAGRVSYGYAPATPVVRNFSTLILRGDKVGVIGPNGSGKTTLLRILTGELQPQQGSVRHGVHLQMAYFDQLRAQLDQDRSVAENVADGNDTILFNGRPRHIMGYLQDFLFTPERARSPVHILSGGERNRLLLAKLFTIPSNLLIMDEPTNDLDTETLELLEELLLDYPGTLLLVSHDRTFINNVVTSTLVMEADGRVGEYVGGYDDWLRQRRPEPPPAAKRSATRPAPPKPKRENRPTLGYKEKRELESLPQQIELLEEEQKALYQTLSDPAFYRRPSLEIAKTKARLEAIEQQLTAAYERWEQLEDLQIGGNPI